MRWFSGGTHRFRPVVVSLLFLVIPLFVFCPAGASSCGLFENACPVCPAGGLALNDSSAWDGNYPDDLETSGAFAGLTCNYGNRLSGNWVTMKIDCYKDAGIAKKWYQYYRKEIPYPFPETGYGSANQYAEHTRGHRVMPVANFGTYGNERIVTTSFREAYADWDYAQNGRYETEIESVTPTDTITQKEASAKNVERIRQFTTCFASFNPGGAQQTQAKQVIKGTIRGSRLTKEFYTDLTAAINDEYSGRSPDKRLALEERLNAGGYAKNPIRHVKVIWKGSTEAGGKDQEYTTSTDASGKYEIPAVLEPGKQYEFIIEFTYRKGSTEYFSISDAEVYDVARYSHVFDYTGEHDLQQDIDILTVMEKDADKATLDGYTSTLMLYDETANAFEFFTEHMGEKLDCNLPLHVYPFQNVRRTVFQIDAGTGKGKPAPAIIITPADSSPDNPFRFQYVVYHEVSHYAMYCLYGKKFPESPADKSGPIKTINHGGYMNPSTSDSFVEGFAEFIPAVIAEYYGNPSVGKGGGISIEDEFMAWDDAGKAESHAVSSTLWSLYDTDAHYESQRSFRENELRKTLADPALVEYEADLKGITVDEYQAQVSREISLLQSGKNTFLSENPVRLRFDEIWPVLRTYQQDVAGVHDSFVSRYPAKKAAIDTVFVNHGFYRDTNRGNGSYDPGEPFRPASVDRKTWAAGDPFIDCPRAFRYTGTETVGPAGDYLRTTRRSTEPLPGHFIKTPVDVPLYVIRVEYEDRPWKSYRTLVSGTDAMVPVPVPPPAEKAGITVVPVGVKYERPLFFRSEDFNRNFAAAASRGYYLEHDFKVSGPIPARTVVKAGGSVGILSQILTARGPALRAWAAAGYGDYRGLALLLVPVAAILAAVLLLRRKDRLR